MGRSPAITDDLAAFLESDEVAIWIALAGPECVPQTTRAVGARVERDKGTLRLFVPTQQSARALANARRGAAIAATFVKIDDYRAVQIKGEIVDHRPCDDDERRLARSYRDGFVEANVRVGMQREVVTLLAYWPCACIEVVVRERFVQTPGPNAGNRL